MQSTIKIGPYTIRIDYDDELDLYRSTVVNRPYRVRLTAPTRELLTVRLERLFAHYFGVQPA